MGEIIRSEDSRPGRYGHRFKTRDCQSAFESSVRVRFCCIPRFAYQQPRAVAGWLGAPAGRRVLQLVWRTSTGS